jgi:hypothetical protein
MARPQAAQLMSSGGSCRAGAGPACASPAQQEQLDAMVKRSYRSSIAALHGAPQKGQAGPLGSGSVIAPSSHSMI